MKRLALGTAVALTGALAVPTAAAAHTSDDHPQVVVVARGLNNPRGVLLTSDDRVLVAEAGKGGAGPCINSPEGGQACLGSTGSVTAVGDGRQRQIVSGLPSLAGPSGDNAVGLTDLALGPDGLTGVIGLGANPDVRAGLGSAGNLFASLVALSPGRPVKQLADLGGYERAHNPDQLDPGSSVDTNPYALLTGPDGTVVADAGGNDLLRVDRRGNISTVAVFHATFVDNPFAPGTKMPMQAVPTSVARGSDGSFYVGQLTGFPFPVGGASLYRVVPGQAPTVVASGFTHIIDVAVDRKGRIYVLEIAKNGLLSGDPTGALYRIDRNGNRTELAAGQLTAPGGVAVDKDGTVYVSNKSTSAGGGELLRIGG